MIVIGGKIFGFSKVVAILETGWYLSPVCLMTKLMFIDPPIQWQTLESPVLGVASPRHRLDL